MRLSLRLPRLIACASLLATCAAAGAAVLEINQTCAVTGGCLPGDTGGFPVTISQPGEYRLTSNLSVKNLPTPENVTAIQVDAADVDLDFNGFGLFGATTCSGFPTTCLPVGSGYGVLATKPGTAVHDGSVAGFGAAGLALDDGLRVERMRLWNNGREGLRSYSSGGILTDSMVFANGGDGAHTYRYTVVTGSTFVANNANGFYGDQYSAVEESISWGNGRRGYQSDVSLSAHFSVANGNRTSGIGGAAYGCVAANNVLYGVTTAVFTYDTVILQSVLTGNSAGPWLSGNVSLGQNACNGSAC
ncbi:MAG TPA: hypothetical protein VGV61_01410 [Thermoanaerobaculia bacterium]|jgi:hypothetical protein|nr:hypothetical protein [Thermoanaerobaculia bacterium]